MLFILDTRALLYWVENCCFSVEVTGLRLRNQLLVLSQRPCSPCSAWGKHVVHYSTASLTNRYKTNLILLSISSLFGPWVTEIRYTFTDENVHKCLGLTVSNLVFFMNGKIGALNWKRGKLVSPFFFFHPRSTAMIARPFYGPLIVIFNVSAK